MLQFAFKAIGLVCCSLAALLFALGVLLNAHRFRFGSPPVYDARIVFITVGGEEIDLSHFELGLWIAMGITLLAGISAFVVSRRTRRNGVEPHIT